MPKKGFSASLKFVSELCENSHVKLVHVKVSLCEGVLMWNCLCVKLSLCEDVCVWNCLCEEVRCESSLCETVLAPLIYAYILLLTSPRLMHNCNDISDTSHKLQLILWLYVAILFEASLALKFSPPWNNDRKWFEPRMYGRGEIAFNLERAAKTLISR